MKTKIIHKVISLVSASFLLLAISSCDGLQDVDPAFLRLAKAGDPIAQNDLGAMYQKGEIVHQDYSKAVEWYQKAADQNLPIAQYNLAYCYEFGLGTEQNYQKAENDEEMKDFLRSEIETNQDKIQKLEEKMKVLLLPRDPMDDKDIMLEIRDSAYLSFLL